MTTRAAVADRGFARRYRVRRGLLAPDRAMRATIPERRGREALGIHVVDAAPIDDKNVSSDRALER